MRFYPILFACLMSQVVLFSGICSAQEETQDVGMRLANGAPIEGTFQSAAPEGLTVESPKGAKVLPWKYLSAGTRWRYERPMLADLEAKRIKAEKAAKAKAEAAAKAAAAKAAADAAKKTAGTNAVTTPLLKAPATTVPGPVPPAVPAKK